MQRRWQNLSLLGALGVALVLLGACSSDGGAEKSLNNNGGNAVAATETSAEDQAASESGAALEVQTGGEEPATVDNDAAPADTETASAAETGNEEQNNADATTDADETQAEDNSSPGVESITEEVGEVLTETGEGLSGAELEQYLARRYEAYWQAFDLARRAPTGNPTADYPALATLAAGEQLELTYGELVDLSQAGHAIREPETAAVPGLDPNSAHRIRIESLESGVAELVSCLVNDNIRFDVASGEVLNERVITAQTRTTMAKADGTWKVIRSAAVALDEGVAGCWLEPEDAFPL